jgi:hypothetical protein
VSFSGEFALQETHHGNVARGAAFRLFRGLACVSARTACLFCDDSAIGLRFAGAAAMLTGVCRVMGPNSLVLLWMRSAVLETVAVVCAGHVPKLN